MDRGLRLSLRIRHAVGDEFRSTRIGLGLSQAAVARACALSQTQVSRIERAALPGVTLDQLCRISSVLGLDLSVKLYLGGPPLRDRGQLALIERLRSQLASSLRSATEVPMASEGDLRAWDVEILGTPKRIVLEAETRLRDVQAFSVGIMLKARDSGVDLVILLVADTHANRAAVHAAEASFRACSRCPPGRRFAHCARVGTLVGGR